MMSSIWIFLSIWIELLSRYGLRDAFAFKKGKNYLKKEQQPRKVIEKILGVYRISQSKAPCHMLKYSIIRICNIAFIMSHSLLYFLLSNPFSERILIGTACLQGLLLFLPLLLDGIFLTTWSSNNKQLDFNRSRWP